MDYLVQKYGSYMETGITLNFSIFLHETLAKYASQHLIQSLKNWPTLYSLLGYSWCVSTWIMDYISMKDYWLTVVTHGTQILKNKHVSVLYDYSCYNYITTLHAYTRCTKLLMPHKLHYCSTHYN